MSYCSECGSNNSKNNFVCANCGTDLDIEPKCDPNIKDMIEDSNHDEMNVEKIEINIAKPEVVITDEGVESSTLSEIDNNQDKISELSCVRHRSEEESQLGKGLIKPTKIEVGVDGFHFCFDKPPMSLNKKELVSKNVAELKVSEASVITVDTDETEAEVLSETAFLDSTLEQVSALVQEQKQDFKEIIDNNEAKVEVTIEPVVAETEINLDDALVDSDEELSISDADVVVVAEPENDAHIELTDEALEEETVIELINDESCKEEVITASIEQAESDEKEENQNLVEEARLEDRSEAIVPGSELIEDCIEEDNPSTEIPVQVMIEGRQTWYGVPLPNVYQITNKAIIMIDQNHNQAIEYDLKLIVGVMFKQNWISKWLGVGDLFIDIKGCPTINLKGVLQPKKVLKTLEELLGKKL